MSAPLADFQVEEKDPFVGTVLAGRYRILRKLGGGGMGAVYEAEHVMLGRSVAVKVLHAQFAHDAEVVRRFMNEARAAAQLAHRNIIECTDVGQHTDGSPFLVLSLLRGTSLADEIARVGPMPVGRVVRIVRQICSALSAAHGKGIVHRDMKPDNVFLEAGPDIPVDHVRVLDFGISKFTASASGATKTGSMLGTPYYMSPEQFNDASKVDVRTDVYAVGAIFFEALTGRPPFEASTLPGILMKVVSEPIPDLRVLRPDVPVELAQVVTRAMAKSPSERFDSMVEFAAAIEPYAHLDAAPVVVAGPPRERLVSDDDAAFQETALAESQMRAKAPRATDATVPERKRPLLLVVGVSVAVAVVIAGVVASWPRRETATAPARQTRTQTRPVDAPAVVRVHLHVASPTPGAMVVFRGAPHALPLDVELDAAPTPELVEVRAPGRVARRYGVSLGESRSLWVELERGEGVRTASDAELALALAGVPVGESESSRDVAEPAEPPSSATARPARRTGNATGRTSPPPLLTP